MLTIEIIIGVIAYLVIGAVLAGLAVRTFKHTDNLGEFCVVTVVGWPLVLVLAAAFGLIAGLVYTLGAIIKFIGGVSEIR